MPRPVARIVEAQSRWTMQKTALITIVISLLFGLGWGPSDWMNATIVVGMVIWFFIVFPIMLMISAWMSTQNKLGGLFLNIVISVAIWWTGVCTALMGLWV